MVFVNDVLFLGVGLTVLAVAFCAGCVVPAEGFNGEVVVDRAEAEVATMGGSAVTSIDSKFI